MVTTTTSRSARDAALTDASAVSDAVCDPPGLDLIPVAQSEHAATVLKALADPVRLRLLLHIASAEDGTTCACHLPQALGISQPTLSHHLRKLVQAGLITREQRGRWAHYTGQPAPLRDLLTTLSAVMDSPRV